jgi:hypothetical protein
MTTWDDYDRGVPSILAQLQNKYNLLYTIGYQGLSLNEIILNFLNKGLLLIY